ncbi:MAG: hypothetical protein IJ058_03945 [Lachnospiraceae bacterium]|nr:hypothetical protein [Lachnospiraceae bacterium]
MKYADMKNSFKRITFIIGTALLLTACGGEPAANTPPVIEPIDSVTESQEPPRESGGQSTGLTENSAAADSSGSTENSAAADPSGPTDDSEAVNTDEPEENTAVVDTAGSGDSAGAISTDTALSAVRNYYMTTTGSQDDSDKGAYWDVSTNEAGEIVVLYRSYTGSINRFYVNAESGDAYVTEQVPGIIDDEQKTGESFNVRSYIQ